MPKAKLTKLELLSPLPDLFLMENGKRVENEADWEARRAEMMRLAVDMQYGGMTPEPEFLEAEALYHSERFSSYRIHTGRREKEITFVMQVVWPGTRKGKFPIIVDGDGCFPYVYNEEILDVIRGAGFAMVRFNRVELAHDIKEDVHTDGLSAYIPA